MEPIVDLPDDVEIDPDGPMRLVRVEYESGGEDFDTVEVFDRAAWLERTGDDETWRTLARQEIDGSHAADSPGERMVHVELPGWWVDSEAEDADRGDMTWRRAYGEVYGKANLLAIVDYEWSAGKAAWSFPTITNSSGKWVSPGKYGPGGPKSLLPVTFPVGTPAKVDGEKVSRREAREAAPAADDSVEYDWEAAIEAAEQRAESKYEAEDEELDISAINSLEEHGQAVNRAGSKALVRFNDEYNDRHGVAPDPETLSAAAEAIAHGLRESKGLDAPRTED